MSVAERPIRRPTSDEDPRCEDYLDGERERWDAEEITARDERTRYWHQPPPS